MSLVQKMIYKLLEKFGNNVNKSEHKTIFIDLDGTIVCHNYYPFIQDDRFHITSGAISFLQKLREDNCYVILTTGRSRIQCIKIIKHLKKEYNFKFDKCIYSLPTGKRVLINDYKNTNEHKVSAYEIKRDHGLRELLKHEL